MSQSLTLVKEHSTPIGRVFPKSTNKFLIDLSHVVAEISEPGIVRLLSTSDSKLGLTVNGGPVTDLALILAVWRVGKPQIVYNQVERGAVPVVDLLLAALADPMEVGHFTLITCLLERYIEHPNPVFTIPSPVLKNIHRVYGGIDLDLQFQLASSIRVGRNKYILEL